MGTEKVLVVARTRMGNDYVCVGAISASGEHLRLMNQNCWADHDANSPYQIGDWWSVQGQPCGEQKPPHVEDFAVAARAKLGVQNDLDDYLRSTVHAWNGPIDVLFDGKIRFTSSGGGYISPDDVPREATGFWMPATRLTLNTDARGRLGYYTDDGYRHLNYVGTDTAIPEIAAGQLVRVSLARWWKPNNAEESFELRCYGQLSGWYTRSG